MSLSLGNAAAYKKMPNMDYLFLPYEDLNSQQSTLAAASVAV